MPTNSIKYGLSILALMGIASNAAMAQENPSLGYLEEVVVTAQKRAESSQDVPITISVFDANSIVSKNITSITDLTFFTPSLSIAQSAASRTRVRLRGVGSRKFDVGAEGSIGTFVDEIYQPRFSGLSSTLLDIERIEILKGPQGTLFGRNTPGGAISIITKDPTEELEGFVEAGYGNKDSFLIKGGVSGAIVPDKFRVRLSAGYEDKGGFSTNATTGNTDDRKTTAARLQTAILPTDQLTIKASVEYTKLKQVASVNEPSTFPRLLQSPLANVDPRTPDPWSEPLNLDGYIDMEAIRGTFRVDWEGNDIALTSLTGYQHTDLDQSTDFDITSLAVGIELTDEESDTFSQEFRISSVDGGGASLDGRLQWLAGVYYYNDDAIRMDGFLWGADSIPVFLAGGPTTILDALTVDVETESIAFFGQATYDITEQLSLTVGARYTEDKKTFVLTGDTTAPGVPALVNDYVFSGERKWTSFDPKITLNMRWTEDVMTYFTYSQGFKSGGVQFAALAEIAATEVFDPEGLSAYEVGLKSELLDGTLRLNLAAFLYDYTDLQQQRVKLFGASPVALTTNAASSEIKGIDVDVLWAPAREVNLRLSYSYLDAKFDDFIFDAANGVDFSGYRMPSSPEHTISVGGSYTLEVSDGWGATFSTDWIWTDEYNFDADVTDPLTAQDDYLVGNVRLAITPPDDQFSITGYITNLTDKRYLSSVTRQGPAVIDSYANGRRFGVIGRVNF